MACGCPVPWTESRHTNNQANLSRFPPPMISQQKAMVRFTDVSETQFSCGVKCVQSDFSSMIRCSEYCPTVKSVHNFHSQLLMCKVKHTNSQLGPLLKLTLLHDKSRAAPWSCWVLVSSHSHNKNDKTRHTSSIFLLLRLLILLLLLLRLLLFLSSLYFTSVRMACCNMVPLTGQYWYYNRHLEQTHTLRLFFFFFFCLDDSLFSCLNNSNSYSRFN